MTAFTDLPEWLRPDHCVVYFPRHSHDFAEAWPVTEMRLTPSGQTVIVKTDLGEEFRYHAANLSAIGHPKTGPHTPTLLPADDPEALAAAKRTNVLRVVETLRKALQKRPTRNMTTDDICWAVNRIQNAATVAYDDLLALS